MASQIFQCSRCGNPTNAGSRFCSNCGQQVTPYIQQAFQHTNLPRKNSFSALWIVAGILGLCVLCGVIGGISEKLDKNKQNSATLKSESNQATNANSQAIPTATPPLTFAELKAKAQPFLKMPTQSQSEFTKDDLKPFDDLMKPLREIPKEAKEYKEAQALLKQLIDKSSVIGAEIVVLGPKPGNSSWDGNVKPAQDYLKVTLKDYDSSEYLEWKQVTKIYVGKEPYWGTSVKIRAKNSFGAYVINDIGFLIRNNKVVKASNLD